MLLSKADPMMAGVVEVIPLVMVVCIHFYVGNIVVVKALMVAEVRR